MRKLFFLAIFASCTLITNAAWFGSLNYLNELVTSVTDSDENALLNSVGDPIPDLIKNDSGATNNDAGNDAEIARWSFDGVVWLDLSDVGLGLGYWDDADTYLMLQSVDWSDFGYIQKAEHPIVWIQPDIYDPVMLAGTNDDKNAVQDRDLQFLESLNFSGNKFYSFELDGSGITPITSVNFSNNPTLTHLVVFNCPEIVEVDITNSNLPLSTVYAISQTVETGLKYAPQGTVSLSLPYNAVDLSAELTLGGTASEITWTSGAPASSADGVYVFDASSIGQTVTAKIVNSRLSAFEDGLDYEIALTDEGEGTGINAPATDRKVWSDGNQLFVSSIATENVRIYTMDGRLVKQQSLGAGNSSISLDNNLYLVRFADGAVRKIVVQ
ncbi:MAG: T9SS type A sorting domain-containing protein [Candidatus Symbiothrix sp.]|jgi:hypothetical protein|nr:T9SS type A sorting domain-containing protein [Candidatus Symbiothrix sp.]